jgi:uncharacterized membrane protein YphA (DoxX/SURF4 family)
MKNFYRGFFATAALSLAWIQSASAHVKWFVPEKEVSEKIGAAPFYHLTDTAVLVWAALAIVGFVIAVYLDKKLHSPKWLINFGQKYEKQILKTFQILVGLFLISISLGWKIVLVPTLTAESTFSVFLLVAQIIIGLALICNFYPKIAATLLILLYILVSLISGIEIFLENILLFGIAAFIYLQNTKDNNWLFKYKSWAQDILRVSAGASLAALAFTEKLLHPELAQYFLQTHNWNFMQRLGLPYSDNLFILSVGAMETIFGIILISGKVTRLATFALACFFALSVISMLVGYGKWEVEDLAIYAAALVLIIYGKTK